MQVHLLYIVGIHCSAVFARASYKCR